jgi:hypothetical protein
MTQLLAVAILVLPGPAQPERQCPDFLALEQEVDQKLLEVAPGMPLDELKKRSLQLDSLSTIEGGHREAVFLIVAEAGTGWVSTMLSCTFDAEDRLRRCAAERGRSRTQTVTQHQVDALVVGEYLPVVEWSLCPSQTRSILPDHTVSLEYTLPRPGQYHSTARVTLRFSRTGHLDTISVR